MEHNPIADVREAGELTPEEYVREMFPEAQIHENIKLYDVGRLFEIWIRDGHAYWCASGANTADDAWKRAWKQIQIFALKAFEK